MVTQIQDGAVKHLHTVIATRDGHLGYQFALTVRDERSGYSFAVKVLPSLQERSGLTHLQPFDESVARQYGMFMLIDAPQILQRAADVIYAAFGRESATASAATSLAIYAPYGPWEALLHHPTNLGVSARLFIESDRRLLSVDAIVERIVQGMPVPLQIGKAGSH